MSAIPSTKRAERGFTLLEILTVVAIIGILAAFAVPNVITYLRVYQTRSAAQEVAGEITRARLQAIGKNVNLGVLFVVLSPTTYRVVIEDDQDPTSGTPAYRVARDTLANLLADPAQVGTPHTLPFPIEFEALPAATDAAVRFTRFGNSCNPEGTGEPCPAVAGTSYLVNCGGSVACPASFTAGTTLRVRNTRTNMTATIHVSVGGRPEVLQ